MSLLGNLRDLPFEDLLQVFTIQNKSGMLFIYNQQYEAEVCFNHAALHSAMIYQVGSAEVKVYQQGLEAIFELLRWKTGDFDFELGLVPPILANIHTTVDYILLESYRQRDEQEQSLSVLRLVPHLVSNPPRADQLNFELEQWQLLLQILYWASVH
jgi:hypothetical protein